MIIMNNLFTYLSIIEHKNQSWFLKCPNLKSFRFTGNSIQEPLLDWKVVCHQMAIAKVEGDLWIVSQIGRSYDIRISSSPPGLISSDNWWVLIYAQIWFQMHFLSDKYPEYDMSINLSTDLIINGHFYNFWILLFKS